MKTFLEFVDEKEAEDLKAAVLNILGATEEALDTSLIDFENYKELLDGNKHPAFQQLLNNSDKKEAIVTALQNAGSTEITVGDLLALFSTEKDDNMERNDIEEV